MILFLRKQAYETFFSWHLSEIWHQEKRRWVPTKFFSSLGKHLIMQNKFLRVWFTLRSRFTLRNLKFWHYMVESAKSGRLQIHQYLSPAIKLQGRQVMRVKWCCDCYPHCTGHCTSQQSSVESSHSFSLIGVLLQIIKDIVKHHFIHLSPHCGLWHVCHLFQLLSPPRRICIPLCIWSSIRLVMVYLLRRGGERVEHTYIYSKLKINNIFSRCHQIRNKIK